MMIDVEVVWTEVLHMKPCTCFSLSSLSEGGGPLTTTEPLASALPSALALPFSLSSFLISSSSLFSISLSSLLPNSLTSLLKKLNWLSPLYSLPSSFGWFLSHFLSCLASLFRHVMDSILVGTSSRWWIHGASIMKLSPPLACLPGVLDLINASWTSTTTFPFGKSLKKASSPLWSPYPLCPAPLRHRKGLSRLPKRNFPCLLYPSNYPSLSPLLLHGKPLQLVLDHQSWAQSRPNLLSSYHPHLLQEGWSQSHTLDCIPIPLI